METEHMKISLSAAIARFVRTKVERGEYTDASHVVSDALRRMQQAETTQPPDADFESTLTPQQRARIRRRVRQGIKDIEEGRYTDYDAAGLMNLAHEIVAASAKKYEKRRKRK